MALSIAVSTDVIDAHKSQDLDVLHLNKGIQSYITAQEEARLNPQQLGKQHRKPISSLTL